jgi:hypothetical protein
MKAVRISEPEAAATASAAGANCSSQLVIYACEVADLTNVYTGN